MTTRLPPGTAISSGSDSRRLPPSAGSARASCRPRHAARPRARRRSPPSARARARRSPAGSSRARPGWRSPPARAAAPAGASRRAGRAAGVPEQEGGGAEEGERLRGRLQRRVLRVRAHGQEERHRQARRGGGEEAHPPPREARLAAARAPEPPRGEGGQHRPVDQEADEVGDEEARPRLSLLRERGQRERPEEERDGHRLQGPLDCPPRPAEGGREAVEQVREEEQQGDLEPLGRQLEEPVRVLRRHPADDRDERQVEEGEHRPEARRRVPARPDPHAHRREREERGEIQVAKRFDECVQASPRGGSEIAAEST